MKKALAIGLGLCAALSVLAGAAHSDPRGGHEGGGYPGGRGGGGGRGGESQGFGRGGYGAPYRGGGGGGEYRAPPPVQAYRPPSSYYGGGSGYRYAPPAQSYRYAPPTDRPAYPPPTRRPNSLGSEWREQQEEARSGVRQGAMAPLGSVIAGIGHRSSGRPLDAGIEYQGVRAVYRVRWLTNTGRRVDYLVDAATGRILSEH